MSSIIVMSVMLGFHILPGFHAVTLIEETVLSSVSIAYSNRFSLDKYLIGLLIIAYFHSTASRALGWEPIVMGALRGALIAAATIFPVGMLIGVLSIDLKWPDFLPLWLMSNLLFTCVTEEAFFRGLIQAKLQEIGKKLKYGQYIAISVTAILFGIVHFKSGIDYIVLASIAGFIYGWIYYKTDRVEAAILTHFGFNLMHVIFFSYPLKALN